MRCERGVGGFERGGADVDGLIEDLRLKARGGAEQDAGLGGGAGAELGDRDRWLERAEDLVGVGGEDRALGAGEVVLGECGDLLEEFGAAVVVEEPGWEGLLRHGGEAGEGGMEDGFVEGGEGGGGHGSPREKQNCKCAHAKVAKKSAKGADERRQG